jgi:hypothetical protein
MVAAGPKTSVSCTARTRSAVSSASSVGATNADLAESMPSSLGASLPPAITLASPASRPIPSSAAACCARVTSGPMRVVSLRGSPTVVLASRAASASATAPARSAGTRTRRIAVHFWPAFTVISRATSLTKASNAGVAAATPGASNAALTLSASTLTAGPRANTVRWARILLAVSEEPVKAMTSASVTWSSRSPMPPHSKLSAPSGSTFAATTSRTI